LREMETHKMMIMVMRMMMRKMRMMMTID
jgi:hypothetical protein